MHARTANRLGTGTLQNSDRARPRLVPIGTIAIALTVGLAGCGEPFSNAMFEEDILYLEALPSDVLYLKTPEETANPVARPGEASAEPRDTDVCDPDLLRTFTVQTAETLNSYIYNLLTLLDKIRSNPPSQRTENSRVWGPFPVPDSDVYVRLEVTRGQTLFSYEVTLSYDPEDMNDVVLSGFFRPGSTADEGAGQFSYAFTIHQAYFPDDVKVAGNMDVTYSTLGPRVTVDADLNDIVRPGQEPVDALYAYDAPGDGSGLFFFSQPVEVVGPAAGEPQLPEQGSVWSGWHEDGWGRSDIRYDGGNLGDKVVGGVECWNPAQEPVYAYMAGCPFDGSAWDSSLCIESSIGWNEEVDAAFLW